MKYMRMPRSIITTCACFGACHCFNACDCDTRNCSCWDYTCTDNCGANCSPVI